MKFEPHLALDGGPDGLTKIRQLCGQLEGKLKTGGCLLLEIGQGQAEPVRNLLREISPQSSIETLLDLNGIERVVTMLTPSQ
jgi:release factor glutamine methyltransferase